MAAFEFIPAPGSSGGGGGISGSGTTNTITKFTGATAVGNSSITDTGSLVTFSTQISTPFLMQTQGNLRLVTDVTNATTTMTNLTNLTVNMVSGKNYCIVCSYFVNQTLAADGILFDFGGGSATFSSSEYAIGAVVGTSALGIRFATNSLTTAVGWTSLTAANDTAVTIIFSGVCNGSGTLIPRFAESSHVSGTATVRGLSFINVTLMAN